MEARRLQLIGKALEQTLEDEDAFDIEASTGSVESRNNIILRMSDLKVFNMNLDDTLAVENIDGDSSMSVMKSKRDSTDIINASRQRMTGRGRLEQVLKIEKQTLGLIEKLTEAKQEAGSKNKFDEEEKIEVDLSKLISLSSSLKKITSQNFPMSVLEIERKLALVGTSFLTSDYIFCAPHPDDGLSIGSLLIQIGSRVLLGRIVNIWPSLSINTLVTPTENIEALSEMHRRPSLAGKKVLSTPTIDSKDRDPSVVTIDLGDACSLRLAGFSFQQLRASGKFTDIQILQAGCFSAKELRDVGFRVSDLRGAGYSVQDCRLAGFDVAQVTQFCSARSVFYDLNVLFCVFYLGSRWWF